MTLTHRRILYILFFIIFFITAPLVILWAEGYKFDWRTHGWQKTGVLFLESKPKAAEIYLNGKLQSDKTTARLKGLLPGEYLIEIKKDGYKSWSKKLTIYPNTTTFAQYIRLFKDDLPTINLLNQEIIALSEKESHKTALAVKEKEIFNIYLLDLENGQLEKLAGITNQIQQLLLNDSADRLLIKTPNSWLIFNMSTHQMTDLEKISKLKLEKVSFDKFDSNIFYGVSKLGLEKINIGTSAAERIITGQISDYYLDSNTLYYLQNIQDSCKLFSAPINNPTETKSLAALPCSTDYKFYPAPSGLINFIDQSNQMLYVFDFNKNLFGDKKTILPEVKYLAWHPNEHSLLFANDFEIWTFQQKDGEFKKQLITRLGTKIYSPFWFSFDTHLLYLTDQGLYITELIISQNKYVTSYEKIKNSKKAFINARGDKIYWLTENGLYESEVQ